LSAKEFSVSVKRTRFQ